MRQLTHLRYRTTGEHRAQLVTDFSVDLEKGYNEYHEYADEDGFHFATLEDDVLTIHAPWGWDKCSPSFRIAGFWVGTYSGVPETFASAIHDATRLMLKSKCVPFTRKDTDVFFWDALRLKGSKIKRTYYTAVASPIGSLFMWLTRKQGKCECLTCPQF